MDSVARGLTPAIETFFTGRADQCDSFKILNAQSLGDLEEAALATAAAAGAAQSMAPPNQDQTARVKKRVINLIKRKEDQERTATEFEEGDLHSEAQAYLRDWKGFHHFNQQAQRQGEEDVANTILNPSEEFVRRALYSVEELSSLQ